MKIGILAYGLDRPLTGISRYTIELVKALLSNSDRPDVTILHAGSIHPLEGKAFRSVALSGCRRLPGLMTLGNALITWHARRLDLDLIHDPIGVAPFLFGAGRAKLVVTLHDVFPWSCPGTSTLAENLIYRHWLPRMIRRANAVITASEHSRKDILRFLPVPRERLNVIPYGIAAGFSPLPAPEVRDHLTNRFNLSAPFILNVGTAVSRKNTARLMEAFSRLADDYPNLCLILAGPTLRKGIPIAPLPVGGGLSERIIQTGPISDLDLSVFYNACELFVFPSLYEGFGLPPLEAMACGAPVICSNVSSLPDVVGDAALLINPLDPRSIEDAMRKILSNAPLREQLRKKGLERSGFFSWQHNAAQTMDVYRKVVYH